MAIIAIYQPEVGPMGIISAMPKDVSVDQAKEATPNGLPFKFIDSSQVPDFGDFGDALKWDGDLSVDNDGFGTNKEPFIIGIEG